MKDLLQNLSCQLLELHKDLLNIQIRRAEDEDGRRYSAPDLLQLTVKDSRFTWLRKLSSVITEIDESVHAQEEVEIVDLQRIYEDTSRLIQNDDTEFAGPYQQALATDPHLYLRQSEVRSALEELQPYMRSMHEMHSLNEKEKYTLAKKDDSVL